MATLLLLTVLAGSIVTVGCLKGRYAMSLVGVFFVMGIPALLAALRLARTDSWWARRYYDDTKMAKAAARYPTPGRRSSWTL